MISNNEASTLINSQVRQVTAKVELYNGSTLINTFKHDDKLISFQVERVGTGKFFGYGVCQKINIKLIDLDRKINISTDNSFKVYFNGFCPLPTFFVTEVHRDENTNELSITAYDRLYKASKHTVSELNIEAPYTIAQFAIACGTFLGFSNVTMNNIMSGTSFSTTYEEGANFDGSETLREALDFVAEAVQAVYFSFYNNDELLFKRLNSTGNPVLTIDKSKYFTLDTKTNRRLSTIIHATELGDNISVSTGSTGSTQYVRNNPFWDLRDDVDTLLENALAAVGNITINQFECEWRGNYLLEIGDKISLLAKDGTTVTSYLLNDTLTYDGTLSQKSEWTYEDNEEETASNPATLGDALKQTYAKVDKANKRIELVASEVTTNSENISSLQVQTAGISATVSQVETNVSESLDSVGKEMETLTKKVEATMTAEDVKLEIKSELSNGVTKVETNTGFTFNDEGLTVTKSNSEMKTQITEDGMTVYKNDDAVLIANNVGVEAINLHASTYLIIGTNSRFEDYKSNRTGCFWIGS